MFAEHYHEDMLRQLRKYKEMAEKAIAQVSEDQFFASSGPESNSIALIMKHLSGNMRSRWTDFLTTDGEKPDRQRNLEFIRTAGDTREGIREQWEDGWRRVFDAIEPLGPDDFTRPVTIRGEPHTVLEAIDRQLTHYAYHVGQIVLMAKEFAGGAWQSLSIPRRALPAEESTPDVQLSEDERAIRDLVDAWMSATKNGDSETVLSLMAEDAVFLVSGQPPFGKSAFAEAVNAQTDSSVEFDGESNVLEITVRDGLAYMLSDLRVTARRPGSGETVVRAGHTLTVLRKENGKWLLARDANLLVPVETSGGETS